jgi:hypothetical protein
MVKSRVRTASTGSLTQEPRPQMPLEAKLPPAHKAQELTKQRKESPAAQEVVVPPPVAPLRAVPPPRVDASTGCAIA